MAEGKFRTLQVDQTASLSGTAGGSDVEPLARLTGDIPLIHSDAEWARTNRFDRHIRIVRNSTNMPELMAWADVAVTAGGSTCWELALMGLPMLVLTLADNQQATAEGFEAHQAAISLGADISADGKKVSEVLGKLLVDKERRRSLSSNAQRLVDGCGASRVMSIMRGEEACA
jgi:spore coat polysaccharide biosynthesis predicted glycosyltransferase SpsG